MSRFGLRKKLKSALNKSERAEEPRHAITYVLPGGREVTLQVEHKYTVAMAADANGITIATGRRAGGQCPDGLCGSCRVEILDGTGLSAMTDFERKVMQDFTDGTEHEGRPRKPGPPFNERTRQACHTKVIGSGARVQILELFDPDSIVGV